MTMDSTPPEDTSLKERIAAAKAAQEEKEVPKKQGFSGGQVVVELISGTGVGAFLGYHTDRYFGTTPIFFITFVLFGVAAAIFNIYKLAAPKAPDAQRPNTDEKP